VAIQTSVFLTRTSFFTVNYLVGNYFEYFDESNLKFEQEGSFLVIKMFII